MVDNSLLQRADIKQYIEEKHKEAQDNSDKFFIRCIWAEGFGSEDHVSEPGETVEQAISRIAGVPYDSMEGYDQYHDDGYTNFYPFWAVKDSEGNKYYADDYAKFSEFWPDYAEDLRSDFGLGWDEAAELAEWIGEQMEIYGL